MKKLILAAALIAGSTAAAFAADFKAPVRAVPAAYSWNGCYLGLVAHYQWGKSEQFYGGRVNGVPNAFLPTGFSMTNEYDVEGLGVGGTAGCNLQLSNFVIGIEGDAAWTDIDAVVRPAPQAIALGLNQNFWFETNQTFFGTVRGRVGYAFDRLLVYATAGVAFGQFELNNRNSVPTAFRMPTEVDKSAFIWGGGVEYAVNANWTVKLEGLYVDYDTMHYGDEPGIVNGCIAGCANGDVAMSAFIARLGVNYKFNLF